MRLYPVTHVEYRCLDCGGTYADPPDTPCCGQEPPSRLLTPDEVAELAQVSKPTVLRWVHDGELAALRDGRVIRVHPDAYDDFVKARTSV